MHKKATNIKSKFKHTQQSIMKKTDSKVFVVHKKELQKEFIQCKNHGGRSAKNGLVADKNKYAGEKMESR